jgi:TolB-like protein/Flp pilus assembly protein TadD
VNLSGDKEQEYFSDGLTEELLNSLARINELQVAARTSAFYFRGEHVDLSTIAHKLNVASILEGSVRRSGHTIRVTAQLNSAITGFQLWSQTYDRDLGDVLKLQSDIANSVASALRVTLLGDAADKIELGGTRNPGAFDAYLRASRAYYSAQNAKEAQATIDGYTQAIRLDPGYALAYADRSLALADFAVNWATGPAVHASHNKAQTDAHKAIALAPDLPEGHLALAGFLENSLEFARASQEYKRALALGPGNARLLRNYGWFAVLMGQSESGLAAVRRAVVLDPLNSDAHESLGITLFYLRRFNEAIAAYERAQTLNPDNPFLSAVIGLAQYELGNLDEALSSCEKKVDHDLNQLCLAIMYKKLGRRAAANAMLARLRASNGDTGATLYTWIYAQWGDTDRALDWLETAMRLRDPRLERIKTAPLLDPLRKEPRFQAVERKLKFPN